MSDQFVLTTQALKGGWGLGLASTAVGLGLWANARLLTTGAVPGGVTLHGVTVALAAAGWIILVRTAALWSTLDGSTSTFSSRAWWRLLSEGARVSRHDLSGTLLLASALVLGVSLVWMFTPVGIVVPGLWAIAAVGVEFRRLGRTQATP